MSVDTSVVETIGSLLASAGIKFGSLVASAIGGFCSLNFFDGTPQSDGTIKPLSCRQKWGVAITGCMIGTYAAGPVIELSQIVVKTDKLEIGLGFALALFGMSIAAQIIKAIRELQIVDYLKSWLPKRG